MGSFPRNYIFLLLICNWTITCGADNIVSILAPESVAQGYHSIRRGFLCGLN
jgi:hypothetical protein